MVRKHNDKVAIDDNDGTLKRMDERIPTGSGLAWSDPAALTDEFVPFDPDQIPAAFAGRILLIVRRCRPNQAALHSSACGGMPGRKPAPPIRKFRQPGV